MKYDLVICVIISDKLLFLFYLSVLFIKKLFFNIKYLRLLKRIY